MRTGSLGRDRFGVKIRFKVTVRIRRGKARLNLGFAFVIRLGIALGKE